jgi:hypothetical protein
MFWVQPPSGRWPGSSEADPLREHATNTSDDMESQAEDQEKDTETANTYWRRSGLITTDLS